MKLNNRGINTLRRNYKDLQKWELSGLLTPTRTIGEIRLNNNGGMIDIWIRINGKETWFGVNKFELMDFINCIEEKGNTILRAESDGNAE